MSDFQQRMKALRQRFIGEAEGDAAELERHAAGRAWTQVRDISHRVAGRAGMFGFPELTDLARALEEAVDADAPSAAVHSLAEDLIRQLRGLSG